jgi:hypothetical protein
MVEQGIARGRPRHMARRRPGAVAVVDQGIARGIPGAVAAVDQGLTLVEKGSARDRLSVPPVVELGAARCRPMDVRAIYMALCALVAAGGCAASSVASCPPS